MPNYVSNWNAWNARCKKRVKALERFRTLCWNVSIEVSQWKQLLSSHFLFHLSLLIRDQWDQKRCGLKCFPWHWDRTWKWRFRMIKAFWNACSIDGLSMVFWHWQQQSMSFCSARRVLCWALLFQRCLSVFIERSWFEYSHCGGWAIADERVQAFRNVSKGERWSCKATRNTTNRVQMCTRYVNSCGKLYLTLRTLNNYLLHFVSCTSNCYSFPCIYR